jgi:hypothetical protein
LAKSFWTSPHQIGSFFFCETLLFGVRVANRDLNDYYNIISDSGLFLLLKLFSHKKNGGILAMLLLSFCVQRQKGVHFLLVVVIDF